MNILVTGANGQLGTSLRKSSAASGDRYIFTDVAELDITDAEAVGRTVSDNSVDVIVNCAAYTNVDRAEDQPELAELLNATAAGILAEAAKKAGAVLIHVSTDYVFGGGQGNTPRNEDEPMSIVIRTAWLYSEYGRNFVKTMMNLTATKPELKVVFDQCGTPTYAQDLADAIFAIIEKRMIDGNEGIYHYSNEGVCSWYDFTKMIAEEAGTTGCDIEPCHSDEFPSKVVRPSYSVLDKTRFKRTFGMKIPYWTDSLKKCVANLKNTDQCS